MICLEFQFGEEGQAYFSMGNKSVKNKLWLLLQVALLSFHLDIEQKK